MQSDLKGQWSLIKGQWSLDSQTPRTNGPKASKTEEKHRARVLHQDAASAPSRRGVEQILATADHTTLVIKATKDGKLDVPT